MSVTDRIIRLDGQLKLHNEGEWNGTESRYSAFNDAGVETEVGEYLYAMVRLLKPTHVLETGTHWGIGASYIGMGLFDNGMGHLDTIEFLPEIRKVAVDRINRLGLQDYVICHLADATKIVLPDKYQLMFLDTEPQTRFAELVRFEPSLEPGGFMFIHDLHRHFNQIDNAEHGFAWPFGKIPAPMAKLVLDGVLRPYSAPTPRGFAGFYKVHPDDYKWE